jgi:hypothetical protein
MLLEYKEIATQKINEISYYRSLAVLFAMTETRRLYTEYFSARWLSFATLWEEIDLLVTVKGI